MKGKSIQLANRVQDLGIETAFVVAAQAAVHAATGNRVYPFHRGDLNLPTPPNIIEAAHKAMQEGKSGYTPNAGVQLLRETLAADFNRTRNTSYEMEKLLFSLVENRLFPSSCSLL